MRSHQSIPTCKKFIIQRNLNLVLPHLTTGDVQTALKQHREILGKRTESHHYSNEMGLIRYAMTGNFKFQLDLKSLSSTEELLLQHVLFLNIELIKTNVDFKLRKKSCRDVVLKAKSQPTAKTSAYSMTFVIN